MRQSFALSVLLAVKLTIYPGVGHGGWDTTYDNPELYTWLLSHSK